MNLLALGSLEHPSPLCSLLHTPTLPVTIITIKITQWCPTSFLKELRFLSSKDRFSLFPCTELFKYGLAHRSRAQPRGRSCQSWVYRRWEERYLLSRVSSNIWGQNGCFVAYSPAVIAACLHEFSYTHTILWGIENLICCYCSCALMAHLEAILLKTA